MLVYREQAVDCEEDWTPHVTDGQSFCAKNVGTFEADVARSQCTRLGADLPLPESAQQNTDLKSLLNNLKIGDAWLGIKHNPDDGTRIWWRNIADQYGSGVGESEIDENGNIVWIPFGTGVA